MTDKNTLYAYRIEQAEETLRDAEVLYAQNCSPRSVINRSYYAVFYAVLALFVDSGIMTTTSKHSGIISLFDKEFVLKGLIEKKFSSYLHSLFEDRQEFDYREYVDVDASDAKESIEKASEFIAVVKSKVSM